MAKETDPKGSEGAKATGKSAAGQSFIQAALAGNKKELESLLEKGADISYMDPERGVTALIIAVARNDLPLAEFLLSRGADPNIGSKQKITEDDKELIRSLRKMREEDPEWKPQGDTVKNEEDILSGKITEIDVSPLGIAMRKRNADMVALLKKFGARV